MPVDLIVTPPPILQLHVTPIARVHIGVRDPHGHTHGAEGSDPIDLDGLHGVLADPQLIEVAHNGTLVGAHTRINFAAGLNVSLTVAEGANAIDVEISSTGTGGGGGEVITAGAGLTRTGSTLDVRAADGSIAVDPDAIRVGILQSDTSHGVRGGGLTHALAVPGDPGTAGFISGLSQQKLDGLPSTVETILGGAGLLKSGSTLHVQAADASIVVGTDTIRVGVLQSDTMHGDRGGGTQHALAVAGGAAGFISGTSQAKLDGLPSSVETITAGAGLTKIDSTLDIQAANGSIVVGPDSVSVGVLQSDAMHGDRGGGTTHALAVPGGAAGFISGASQQKLDNLPSSVETILGGAGMVKSGSTLNIGATDASIVVAADTIGVGVLQSDTMHGVRGGGTQHALAVPGGAAGFISGASQQKLDGIAAGAEVVTAGAGLSKAGSTINVGATDASIVVSTDTIGVGVLQSDTMHGVRGGGTQHAVAVAGGAAGFISGTSQQKLDGIAAGADVTLSALAAAGSDVTINSGVNVISAKTPTAANHLANKAYVDATAQGLAPKAACKVLASTNLPLSGLPITVDGINITNAGDRVLANGQTNAAQNGLYVTAAGAWTRAPDADTSAEVVSGMFAFVTSGNTYADTGWVLATDDPIVLGTTPLSFVQFGGVGTVVAGDGIRRTGQVFDVVAADASIVVGTDTIGVGVLQSDTMHGVRGGGTTHALAVAGGAAGFISGASQQKLDNLPSSVETILGGAGMVKSGSTLNIGATDASIVVGTDTIGVGVLQSDTMHGVRGGGTQHAVAVAGGAAGFISGADQQKLNSIASGAEVVTAGAGLSKSGSTINVGATDASIVVGTDTIGVGVLQSDAMHGDRGGGTTHALAVANGAAGFISGASQAKLDSLTPGEFVTGGAGLVKTGATLDIVAANGSISVGADSISVGVLQNDTMHGDRGGGTMHSVAVANGLNGFLTGTDKAKIDSIAFGAEVVGAGNGLTKSGSTLNVVAANGSITVAADSIAVGVLQSDAMHGNRGGGSLHSDATTGTSGFMSATDKTRITVLDSIVMNGFRLTGASQNPFMMETNNIAIPILYLTTYTSNCLTLYVGGKWQIVQSSSQPQITVTGLATWMLHDIFAYSTNGTSISLEVVAWSNDQNRSQGVVKNSNGVWTKSSDTTRRLIGTIRSNGGSNGVPWTPTAGANDVSSQVGIWNMDNRIPVGVQWIQNVDWTMNATGAWLVWGGHANPGFEIVCGIAPCEIISANINISFNAGTASDAIIAVSAPNSLNPTGIHGLAQADSASARNAITGHSVFQPAQGFNIIKPLCRAGNTTVVIDVSSTSIAGMTGVFYC